MASKPAALLTPLPPPTRHAMATKHEAESPSLDLDNADQWPQLVGRRDGTTQPNYSTCDVQCDDKREGVGRGAPDETRHTHPSVAGFTPIATPRAAPLRTTRHTGKNGLLPSSPLTAVRGTSMAAGTGPNLQLSMVLKEKPKGNEKRFSLPPSALGCCR